MSYFIVLSFLGWNFHADDFVLQLMSLRAPSLQ
jgi:hypothetical protein